MRIFDFAKVSDWDSRLHGLAELAERERWTYRSIPDSSPLPVLDAYVRYTFLRVHEQDKVATTDSLACFNTGLLTPNQEEIFGVFRLNDFFNPDNAPSVTNKKWFLTSWARAGDRQLTDFLEFPPLATYWTDPGELIFNPTFRFS